MQSGKTRKKERVSRGEDSVKVAVRVRPFSQRELESNAKLCVQMDGNITTMLGEWLRSDSSYHIARMASHDQLVQHTNMHIPTV